MIVLIGFESILEISCYSFNYRLFVKFLLILDIEFERHKEKMSFFITKIKKRLKSRCN